MRTHGATDVDRDEANGIARMYLAGEKMEVICEVYGRHRTTVVAALNRMGVQRRPPGRYKPRQEEAKYDGLLDTGGVVRRRAAGSGGHVEDECGR